jgi:hypothetical protein
MALPTPGTLSECGRVLPNLQDHNGANQGIAIEREGPGSPVSALGEKIQMRCGAKTVRSL